MVFRPLLPWLLLLGTALAQAPPCTTAAVTPPPPSYHCGDQGTVKVADVYTSTTASDPTACRTLCYGAKSKCVSFSFNTATNECILATGTIVNQGFKKSTTSNVYYWNKAHCFKVTCPTCPSGQNYCSSLQQCTNLQTDSNNCGACGTVCPADQTCSGGSCACSTAGQSLCNGSCADTSSDSKNCGTCGNVCPADQTCSGGSCACSTAGQSLCNGSCADTSSDANNCGTCGNACPSGSICDGGSCSCPIAGQTLCGSTCYDTLTDANNCGTCGNACPSGSICDGGSCSCPTAGQTLCGDTCLDTSSDNNNCGGCGQSCAFYETCIQGSCKSCSGRSSTFLLQAANVACGNFNGGYPFYVGNDGKGDFFEMDSGFGASSSPVFYLQYSGAPAADGTCSGTLMEVVTGSEVQVGFTDPTDLGDYYVTFNKAGNVPTTNAISLTCYIDSTTNKLICSESSQSGSWFACCSYWRWAPQVPSDCGSFDLMAIAH